MVEVDRTVNATGLVSLAGDQVGVGCRWPGSGSRCAWTAPRWPSSPATGNCCAPCPARSRRPPVPAARRPPGRGPLRSRRPAPVTVQRRVSSRGGIMVARQKIHAGMIHAGKIVTVISENNRFRVVIDGETAAVVPRTTTSEIHRYKANASATRAPEGSDPHARDETGRRRRGRARRAAAVPQPMAGPRPRPPRRLAGSSSSATPPTASPSCARTWTGSSSCSAATTASPCSAPTRPEVRRDHDQPAARAQERRRRRLRRRSSSGTPRRYGAAPPASRVLRIALRATPCGLPLTPETTAAPGARKSGQAQACPALRAARKPRSGGPQRAQPNVRTQVNWRSIVTRKGKLQT